MMGNEQSKVGHAAPGDGEKLSLPLNSLKEPHTPSSKAQQLVDKSMAPLLSPKSMTAVAPEGSRGCILKCNVFFN